MMPVLRIQLGRIALAAGLAAGLSLAAAQARPLTTKEGVLPPGTELNDDQLDRPNELFYSEKDGGERTYASKLGDMLFATPGIFGGMARQAALSCAVCHQQGHNNPKLFIPGLSSRPGTFATANELFSPHGGGKSEPVTPPSLRGAAHLAPFGHDGRFATLRDFIRNAVVNEFGGTEPSEQVVAAIDAYIKDISFLPNAKLGADGKLAAAASDAARRGEQIFSRPFRNNAAMSCASCHQPGDSFVDHKVHDVGSGGPVKTRTLVNANFSAPYFHDGRFDTYEQVVDYFDRYFGLGYSPTERHDLVAYLNAVGDADEPTVRNSVQAELDEISLFVSVLDTAIPERNAELIDLTVETVGNEWRELGESFPPAKDSSVSEGLKERMRARDAVRNMVLTLRRVAMAAQAGNFDDAARAYSDYRKDAGEAGRMLKVAEPFSLFNPPVREAHFKALDRLTALAQTADSSNR
jgi:cytochrome c peroxidase